MSERIPTPDPKARWPEPLERGEIIEVLPGRRYEGCLLVVDEPRSWGCIAVLRMPDGDAPIRMGWADFRRLSPTVRAHLDAPLYGGRLDD